MEVRKHGNGWSQVENDVSFSGQFVFEIKEGDQVTGNGIVPAIDFYDENGGTPTHGERYIKKAVQIPYILSRFENGEAVVAYRFGRSGILAVFVNPNLIKDAIISEKTQNVPNLKSLHTGDERYLEVGLTPYYANGWFGDEVQVKAKTIAGLDYLGRFSFDGTNPAFNNLHGITAKGQGHL